MNSPVTGPGACVVKKNSECLDMLNNFLYAQKSLFIDENANANFFLTSTTTTTPVSVTFEPIQLVPI